jgi:putative phage-type endonuclease
MKLVQHDQGSDAWKAWRREGIGGSDVAAILGLSPYIDPPHTRAVVFAEKVHGIERDANFAMRRGTRLEPAARKLYRDRARCTTDPICVEMDGCPWARVSLDGLCTSGAVIVADRVQWILELKCPNWQTHDAALNGVVAEHFNVQCQWQLLVCGLDRCDFASFNPGARFSPAGFPGFEAWRDMPPLKRPPAPVEWLAVCAVEPDRAIQAQIMEEAGRFWMEVLEARAAFDTEAKRDRPNVEAEFA